MSYGGLERTSSCMVGIHPNLLCHADSHYFTDYFIHVLIGNEMKGGGVGVAGVYLFCDLSLYVVY